MSRSIPFASRKLSSSGTQQWFVQRGDASAADSFTGVTIDASGNVVAMGASYGTVDGSSISTAVFVGPLETRQGQPQTHECDAPVCSRKMMENVQDTCQLPTSQITCPCFPLFGKPWMLLVWMKNKDTPPRLF